MSVFSLCLSLGPTSKMDATTTKSYAGIKHYEEKHPIGDGKGLITFRYKDNHVDSGIIDHRHLVQDTWRSLMPKDGLYEAQYLPMRWSENDRTYVTLEVDYHIINNPI